MSWIQRLIDRALTGAEPSPAADRRLDEERDKTQRAILRTLTDGLDIREAELEIIEHSALVAALCGSVGRLLHLSEADAYILETAARLHEIGMFAVPPELLLRTDPLSPDELERVRAQARISADLASTMHHPRVARLIEYQYEDYTALADRMPEADLLLAGILRVADVIAAVTRPRPYQESLPPGERAVLLERGAGTRFHPLAVQGALQLSRG